MERTVTSSEDEQRIVYSPSPQVDEDNERRYRDWKRKAPIVLAWVAVVLIVIFLVLFISSKVGRFESIPDMLYFIQQHL